MSHCYWNIAPPVEIKPEERAGGKYSPLLIQLLHNRGLKRVEEFAAFLASDRSLLGDPMLLSGMRQAMDRINLAIRRGEKIAIYGDFDADGITATATLVQGFGFLGLTAVPYIPHRDTEGHGLAMPVLDDFKKEGISLVITVDCGVTDVAETKEGTSKGLDIIIITDHHSPLEQIPDAVAVINPKLKGSKYPYDNLAGVGVAYKLLEALLKEHGRKNCWKKSPTW